MESDEVVHKIGEAIVHSDEVAAEEWDKLAVVVHVREHSREMNGFLYSGNSAARPSTPSTSGLLRLFRDLREAMLAEGRSKSPWKACVARIDAESGEISMEFEYDDADKWLVSPATMTTVAESIRPA